MSHADELWLKFKWQMLNKYNSGNATENDIKQMKELGWIK